MTRSACIIAAARGFVDAMEKSVTRHHASQGAPGISSSLRAVDHTAWVPIDMTSAPHGTAVTTALASSDLGLALHRDDEGKLTMYVQDGAQTFGRPIAQAMRLSSDLEQGAAAEKATIDAVSVWGLTDFVMNPQTTAKGSAQREIGDGTIISGARGIALQVKSRHGEPREPAREQSWLQKKASEGARQAQGTVRTLRMGAVDMVNGRDRTVRIDGTQIEWVGVVVIDHPSPPEKLILDLAESNLPTIVILRRDWDFLFEQLRSVSAVVDYCHRVASKEPCALGDEVVRYFQLADADERSVNPTAPPWARRLGCAVPFEAATLPKAPANSADTTGHLVFRAILEDIAASETDRSEWERLETLALIDRFGVGERALLGRLLLNNLDDVMQAPVGDTLWRFRRVIHETARLQLAFGTCTQFTELHREAFVQWATLRHHDFSTAGIIPRDESARTVAVLLTPRYDGRRPWDTSMVAIHGRLDITDDELEQLRRLWTD